MIYANYAQKSLAWTLLLSTHTHSYQRHRPEQSLLYQIVERHYPDFKEMLSKQGKSFPRHVEKEFDEFLKCGRLEHGFLRVVCDDCKQDQLVAFSRKKRGFYSGRSALCPPPFGPAFGCSKSFQTILCPSCGARRMAESAKLLVDDVLGGYPMRQWVLSLPIPLRLLRSLHKGECQNHRMHYRACRHPTDTQAFG